MNHERLKEDLSAYLDGELGTEERAVLERHLEDCPECRGELERLRRASRIFRAQGARQAPEGLVPSVLGGGSQRPEPRWRPAVAFAAGLLAVLIVLLAATQVFRPQLAGIFNQVMGMISGAAASVSGDR